MGTIADKLKRALASKALLKQRLTEKGVDVSQEDVLYNLANKVGDIQTLPALTNPGTAKELLAGKELIAGDGTVCTGTMPDRGAVSSTVSAGGSYSIPEGYHNGAGKVTGASLSSQTPGTAAAGDLVSGKTAWVNGGKITGSLPTNANKTYPTSNNNYLEISGTQFLAHGDSTDQTVIPVGGKVTISGHKNLLGTATPADVKKGVRFSSREGFDIVGTANVSDSRIAVGTYVGSGAGTSDTSPNTINVGFRPKMVFVGCLGLSISDVPWSRYRDTDEVGDRSMVTDMSAGFCFDGFPLIRRDDTGDLNVLEITSSGFTVRNARYRSSTASSSKSYDTILNSNKDTYMYLAIG